MRSKSGILHDVMVQVQAETNEGETVFITGNSPELGEWEVSKAVMLTHSAIDKGTWRGMIKAPVDVSIQYRFMVCIVVDVVVDGTQKKIVRRWESHLRPRVLSPADPIDGNSGLCIFGIHGGIESVESGWLTSETIVQLKMFNSPVTIWKRRYRDKPLSVHVTTIDITRRDSEVFNIEDESTSPDAITVDKWPVVEVAIMNEENWKFTKQSQFGHIYEPGDYVIFQAQMLDPETIAARGVDLDHVSLPHPSRRTLKKKEVCFPAIQLTSVVSPVPN